MKLLGILLLTIIATVAVLYTREQNAKSRAHAELMAAELKAAETARAQQAPAQRRTTWVPSLGRYVEHDATVSPMTAAGLNAASGARVPAPVPNQEIRKQQFGWEKSGTSLDQPARR